MPKKTSKAKRSRRPSPKQRKLIQQIPAVVTGQKTKADAMRDAGYKESSVNQHSEVFGSLRVNTAMQEALKKAGVDEPRLARMIGEGLEATKMHGVGGMVMKMKTKEFGHTEMEVPDYATRHKYVVTALELHDAFPAKKSLHGIVDPEELMNEAEKEAVVAPWGSAEVEQ